MNVTFRRLETLQEYRACERLQQQAWDFEDPLDVIPQTQLVTAQKYGGLVLGAFGASDELLGFCYGFLGRDPRGRLVHCSHMLAVAEEARNSGLGARLKWEQRREALDQGLELMVWTYDPLESVNACLNFGKLGGVADGYEVNLYGETTSRLHAGTATDRLTLKWFLRSGRVLGREVGREDPVAETLADGSVDAPWILEAEERDGVAWPGGADLALDAPRLRLEIPGSIQSVKARDPEAAVAWRLATREAFTTRLERGWFVRECLRTRGEPRRTVYLLEKGSCEPDGLAE